jgi:hypothetical protein
MTLNFITFFFFKLFYSILVMYQEILLVKIPRSRYGEEQGTEAQ